MKCVILAGGYGSRLSEETSVRPKPLVEVGGMPILWHIMKTYSAHGINDFVVCLGYKGYMIKQFFSEYFLRVSDVTFDIPNNSMEVHGSNSEPWRVTLVDTGMKAGTGGRLKLVADYLDDETFCFTYGDGLCDVNIKELIAFHKKEGALATLTAVQPPGRFGYFDLHQGQSKIKNFREKTLDDASWVNGGYFVLEPKVLEYIPDATTFWEIEPLEKIAEDGQLSAFKHDGFWQCMDTLPDKNKLDALWDGEAPWKVW